MRKNSKDIGCGNVMCLEMQIMYWLRCKGERRKLESLQPIRYDPETIEYNWWSLQKLIDREPEYFRIFEE